MELNLKKDVLNFIKEQDGVVTWETVVDKFQGRFIDFLENVLYKLWNDGEIYCPSPRRYTVI